MPNGVLRAVLRGDTEDLATAARRHGLKGVAIALTADERWGRTLSQLDLDIIRRKHTCTHFVYQGSWALETMVFLFEIKNSLVCAASKGKVPNTLLILFFSQYSFLCKTEGKLRSI